MDPKDAMIESLEKTILTFEELIKIHKDQSVLHARMREIDGTVISKQKELIASLKNRLGE